MNPGATWLRSISHAVVVGDTLGYINCMYLAEIRCTLARKYNRTTADDYLDWLDDLGIETMDVAEIWIEVSEFVLKYKPALRDSFALATAEDVESTLLVGGDAYDSISDVPIERFRDGSV
ncbi:type II toxin-antitoxin system VapC family toxin [Salinigranum sp. GCM10025319]|uniref:type II toxin-antitoxin system VapC family toxin n=1 Tax=Salinigranum sp. GCM10025319 TaxID=3252687 RepID=UPI0036137886